MIAKTQTGNLVDFALRTADTAWIKRHNGRTDSAGRVIVQVPASQVHPEKFAGNDMLRYRFADAPRDGARETLCPASYVPDTAARFAFQDQPRGSAAAEFIARAAKRR